MVRVCIPGPGLELLNKSGVFETKSNDANEQYNKQANFLLQFLKPSDVFLSKGLYLPCIQRLVDNKSDLSLGEYPLEGQHDHYYVPDVRMTYLPVIISGYEVNEYIKNQSAKPYLKYGLLENYRTFDGETYASIALLITTLLLVKWLSIFLFKSELNKLPMCRFRCKQLSRMARGHKSRSLAVMVNVSFLLLSTPFLLMFKTSQVVTEKPFVVTNYETIMRLNLSILPRISILKKEYFTPSARSVGENDVTARFFLHFKKRGTEFQSEYYDKKDLINGILKINRMAGYFIQKKFIVITHSGLNARLVKHIICASSGPNELFHVFAFQNPTQREILVGNAFRTGFNDPGVRKKMQRWTERMPSIEQVDSGDWFIKYWLDANVLMTKERRLQQFFYCLDEKLRAYQKEQTFASDLRFFMAFWFLLLGFCPLAFALGVFLPTYNSYCTQIRFPVLSRPQRDISRPHSV